MPKKRKKAGKPGKDNGLVSLGICVGASSITICEAKQEGETPCIVRTASHAHEGNPGKILADVLAGLSMDSYDRIAVTGRKFRDALNLSSIDEPEAVERAYAHARPAGVFCPAVVSAGGETFMVYVLDDSGRIKRVNTGNKCASGTGEFFLQQLARMGVSLEEAAEWAASEHPHHVSGRCSVFCKSDCTHATNKGVPKKRVVAGLCRMMADKVLELLKRVERKNVMLAGGASQNRMMVEYLRREIPGLVVPEHAACFEATGAALWALENETKPYPGWDRLFARRKATHDTLPPLSSAESLVEFKTLEYGRVRPGDECLLGLDVGSTTTKAVLVRRDDRALVASVYLRTNGDPVGASRRCYAELARQVEKATGQGAISIPVLGVCGSGRQIAGLHAGTDAVINEIVAHAAAAVHFDPGVDTIFEIGGQDAKYTYLTAGVASDYAMNEACSAGTGSFLEESAQETLGVAVEDIAGIAVTGQAPPNFNDQCAAFIASDIKNAIHEGVAHEDIVAGLVYSICMNYMNRVKGARPVGEKVFMQGGVCYNRAVPLAMASLLGKPMVVPPEPGLMGAFGVALEAEKRMEAGLLPRGDFNLSALAAREVEYGKTFTCKGGKEKCDRGCEVAVIHVQGEKHPFGGACNRWYNLRRKVTFDAAALNLVRAREKALFDESFHTPAQVRGRVAVNRSFFTHSWLPLFSAFFAELGFETVVPREPSRQGMDRKNAAFCYPVELSHGFFHTLLQTDPAPDFIFLPHVKSVYVPRGYAQSQVCPLAQGEPFILRSAFSGELESLGRAGTRVLTPFLDPHRAMEAMEPAFADVARRVGLDRQRGKKAFRHALAVQRRFEAGLKQQGKKALARLEADPDATGVVLFGRPYNAFASEAHMGVPHKLATRGVLAIPHDFLDTDNEREKEHMYWGMGQKILRAAFLVARHPQLFGTYVTNFSCGPDSFVVGYFRQAMGKKPSLTLELDSHTADAGLETRIEAFLDVISSWRKLPDAAVRPKPRVFVPARMGSNGNARSMVTSKGEEIPLQDPRLTLLFPSMGRLSTEGLINVFRANGYNAHGHRPADEAILKLGRANTSCKECLPLILTTGTLLDYVRYHKKDGERVVYFMPTATGPCRFGQYQVFLKDLIKRLEIPDTTVFSLTSEGSYVSTLGGSFPRAGWWAVVCGDVFEDIRSMLLANARDPEEAMAGFDREWERVKQTLLNPRFTRLSAALRTAASNLSRIPLKRPVEEVPVISLVGEIFVRRDSLSRRGLIREMARRGFAVHLAPVAEWIAYTDWSQAKGYSEHGKGSLKKRAARRLQAMVRDGYERRIKNIMAASGLVRPQAVDVDRIVSAAAPYISPRLTGEAVLTLGSALAEVGEKTCGAIAIGPFGCMPNRLSEAVMAEAAVAAATPNGGPPTPVQRAGDLPYLAIESDGSPFPQLVTAQLDAFCLRARRVHEQMRA
ncbi:MAG: activase [Deltaproteobacteria bacterium]|nr:activase [Deltaproteobacteria bacterium]